MITVLLNPLAGAANTANMPSRLTELFRAAHLPARIMSPAPAEFVVAARAEAASGADAVVAAGGDGTVSSVASVECSSPSRCRLCWSTARTTPAVNSGRSVMERPPRSSKVYISFETTSVDSPTPRANSWVSSKIGSSR